MTRKVHRRKHERKANYKKDNRNFTETLETKAEVTARQNRNELYVNVLDYGEAFDGVDRFFFSGDYWDT